MAIWERISAMLCAGESGIHFAEAAENAGIALWAFSNVL